MNTPPPLVHSLPRRAVMAIGELLAALAIVLCIPFVILAIGIPIALCVRFLLWSAGVL
jgi:hypothetical protein